MRRNCLLVSAAVFALLDRSFAQEPGERVRLTVQSPMSRQLVGTFVGEQGDSLWVEVPGQLRPIAVARIGTARLEVSQGQHRSILRGAEIGAGLGAIGGLVTSGVKATETYACGSAELVDVCLADWYGRAFRGGLIGAVVGGAIGAALGSALKTERWAGRPLSHLPKLIVSNHGAAVALSLAF